MNDHQRARQLLYADRVEGLAAADQRWLGEHLSACADCRAAVAALDQALSAMRSHPIAAPAALVARTQLRVAERAIELRRAQHAMLPLRIVSALVIGVAAVNTPLLWAAVRWLSDRLEWSTYMSAGAFLLLWVAPAVVISVVLAASGAHVTRWRQDSLRHAEER